MSVRAAWNLMRDVEIDTLCIVDNEGELQGLITIKDIADANMDLFDTAVLAAASTRYSNLLETLEAELVVGNADTRILLSGTPEEIRAEVKRCMDIGKSCPAFPGRGQPHPRQHARGKLPDYEEAYREMCRRR